jgi:hypothetical protein
MGLWMSSLASRRRRPQISEFRSPQNVARQKITRVCRVFRDRADLRHRFAQANSTSLRLRMSDSTTFQAPIAVSFTLYQLVTISKGSIGADDDTRAERSTVE